MKHTHTRDLNRSSSCGKMRPCMYMCVYVCMYYTRVKSKHTSVGEGTSPPGSNSVSTCTLKMQDWMTMFVRVKFSTYEGCPICLKCSVKKKPPSTDGGSGHPERCKWERESSPTMDGHSTTCPPSSGKGQWTGIVFYSQCPMHPPTPMCNG